MNVTKEQWERIITIGVTALLAIAAVLGWVLPVESPEARAVRERISIDARDDTYLYQGADLYVYSDDHSTQKFHIDGATGNVDSEGDGDFADDLVVADAADIGGNISSSTGAISVTDNIDITGTLNYGAGDLTPLSYDSTTQYEVYVGNASSVTQTTVTSATHLMTTAVDWGICFVSDPDADANDPAYCTISITGTSITFQALDDDGDNATTAATKIYYMIVGR